MVKELINNAFEILDDGGEVLYENVTSLHIGAHVRSQPVADLADVEKLSENELMNIYLFVCLMKV